jgi:putative nucleotidyltransferase with HDIG domain
MFFPGERRLRGSRQVREHWRELAVLPVLGATVAVVALASVLASPDRLSDRSIVLGVAALAAGWLVAGERDKLSVSGSFIVLVLAAAFLGARSAIAAAVISELAAAARLRTRPKAVALTNLPASIIPAVAAALLISAARQMYLGQGQFYAVVALAALITALLSFGLLTVLGGTFFPSLVRLGVRELAQFLPTIALNVALVVAGAAITTHLGNAGLAFALAAVLSFSYMAHLLTQARRRSQQYVSLSWGVLAGLIRSLDVRDERAARHAAAVAGFARDIAEIAGLSAAEVELAHTAGLLHDIGHFALSDRVAERGRPLTDEDWDAIHRHPEIGADLLRDLGMYGPVAEIVLCHHERPDGRGYPRGLSAEQIPEIARIVAVAEVYDTLTASDTYRTPMSSFEALRELRRVAGSQLDGRYVEALSDLLSGESVSYRHADAADFDRELDMERRLREAARA